MNLHPPPRLISTRLQPGVTATRPGQPFQRFAVRESIRDQAKPLKRLGSILPASTRLKPGANESSRETELRVSCDQLVKLPLKSR